MNYTNTDEKIIKEWLKKNLNEERYRHSIGTAECAVKLAEKYGLNKEKAYYAGLLHDAAKCIEFNELRELSKKCSDIDESEVNNKKTLHAPISAYIAKTVFNVVDDEILSAIRWHTLGKTNMSEFDKIIFLADKIESTTRPEDYTKDIRKFLEEDNGLDKAILQCYKNTIVSLVNRELKICPATIDIYNKLLIKISS